MTEINKDNINKLITNDVKQFFNTPKMRKQSDDIEFGIKSERDLLQPIRDKFNDNTITRTGNFDPFDFTSEDKLFELKTRKFKYDTYPTTMIGMNKIRLCNQKNKDIYFIFKFIDKTLYCQYNKDDFETFQKKSGGRYDRGRSEISEYCYIPISYLTEF